MISAAASDACGPVTVTNDARASFPVGTTTVTWTATDVHGLQTSAMQRVTVITAAQATQTLAASVQALVTAGALLPSNGQPLQAKLTQATNAASAGNRTAASNMLGAFVNQVQALVKSGKLTAAQGQVLIDAARAIQHSLAMGG